MNINHARAKLGMVTLSTTEIAILVTIPSAIIAALVSVFTTRYTVKHGPNYSGQITDIRASLAGLAKTQDDLKHLHASALAQGAERLVVEDARAEAARWKPEVHIETKIDGSMQVNALVLKSGRSFALTEVSLISTEGAKLFDYAVLGAKFPSTGFSVSIPPTSLNKIAEASPTFFHQETFGGSFRYTVQREKDSISYTGVIPFHGGRVYVGSNACYKLSG